MVYAFLLGILVTLSLRCLRSLGSFSEQTRQMSSSRRPFSRSMQRQAKQPFASEKLANKGGY
jgi:hypothetical protein